MQENDKIWLKKYPHESNKAFYYFNIYLKMGVERSIQEVHNKHKQQTSLNTLYKWSTKYEWIKRAVAYDEYIEIQCQKQHEKQQLEFFENRLKKLKQYFEATDVVLLKLLIDLGLVEDSKTGNFNPDNRLTSSSTAESIKTLTQANMNNTKLALRLLGLPETITDTQEIDVKGNMQHKNNNINYTVDNTSEEFYDKQLELIHEMIENQEKND